MKSTYNQVVGLMILTLVLLAGSVFTVANAKRQKHENYYQSLDCSGQQDILEYKLPDHTRVDCLTPTEAIEYDFADKWAECIGQALHYGLMTSRKPVCVLILERPIQNKYLKTLRDIKTGYPELMLEICWIKTYLSKQKRTCQTPTGVNDG